MLKAVIMDLDDTIYDYKMCDIEAVKALLYYLENKFGIAQDIGKQSLDRAKEIVKEQLGNVAASHNRMLYMQTLSELCGLKPVKYSYEMYEVYWNTVLEKMQPYPYVGELVSLLKRRGKKIAILSDLTVQIQHRKIIKLGLEDDVDYLVTSEETGIEKPSEQMFSLMLKKLSCKKDEVIMIGDSQEKDIRGAEAFGIAGIWFSEEENPGILKMNGKMLINYLEKLIDMEK